MSKTNKEAMKVSDQGIACVSASSFGLTSELRCGGDTQGCVNTRRMTMKKLMIAASAALCATVSFAELASANIVG